MVEAERLRDTFFHFKVYVTNEEQSYLVSKWTTIRTEPEDTEGPCANFFLVCAEDTS